MLDAPCESATVNRRIVSYFDHEFQAPSLEKLEKDVDEIIDSGFTNTVLCVTESDIASRTRQDYLKTAVTHMNDRGLEVWADPWSVGSVFGGEGVSLFKESGEKSCMCNPKLDTLMNKWLQTTADIGVKTVFWDEPEMKCIDHRNDELRFLEKYTQKAGELALANVVCLCANENKKHQLAEVAALPQVAEIATDPYYPNAFTKISESDRLAYVTDWVNYTQQVAADAGKKSHIWVQAFDIPQGQESMIAEHVTLCQQRMADIAVWGFNGCDSVPNFVKPGRASAQSSWQAAKAALAR